MVKLMVRLNLRQYSAEQLVNLQKLNILSAQEVSAELHTRGWDDFKIVCLLRAG